MTAGSSCQLWNWQNREGAGIFVIYKPGGKGSWSWNSHTQGGALADWCWALWAGSGALWGRAQASEAGCWLPDADLAEQRDETGSAKVGKQQSGVNSCSWTHCCCLRGCCWGVTDRNRSQSLLQPCSTLQLPVLAEPPLLQQNCSRGPSLTETIGGWIWRWLKHDWVGCDV